MHSAKRHALLHRHNGCFYYVQKKTCLFLFPRCKVVDQIRPPEWLAYAANGVRTMRTDCRADGTFYVFTRVAGFVIERKSYRLVGHLRNGRHHQSADARPGATTAELVFAGKTDGADVRVYTRYRRSANRSGRDRTTRRN